MTDRQAALAELQWLTCAPPLLRPCAGVVDGSLLLRTLAADEPAALQRAAAALATQPRPRRLGHHFENLVAGLLTCSARFELVARNLVLRAGGITLGELDMLVRDRTDGELQHWELALKFYLGVPDEPVERGWPGPDPRDQLMHKAMHLYHQQLPRSTEPLVARQLAERGREVRQRVLLTRGALFYPCRGTPPRCPPIDPRHRRGRWWRAEQVSAGWVVPHRYWHLPELATRCGPPIPATRLGRQAQSQTTPLMLIDRNHQTGFLVPDDWPM